MQFVIVILFAIACLVKCDFDLNIKLRYFKNEANMAYDGLKFKICLSNEKECDSKVVTQILGENEINEEQFKQTTEFLKFKILNDQIKSRVYFLNLSISVLSSNERLVSLWNLYIDKKSNLVKLNEWVKFNQINFDLKQQLTFDYEFKCSEGFKGADCSIPICALNCENNGQCITENGQNVCKCDSNLFKGDFCEIKIVHACDSCLNGGSCFGNGECLCPPGYAGAFCQEKKTVSECGLFSCENKGTCFIDNQNEYSCICPIGFTGKKCQVEIKTTSSKTTTTTSISQTKTQSTSSSTILENKVNAEKSQSFTNQEIALILIVGVGIQVLFILVAVIFYKIVILGKKKDQVGDEEKSIEKLPHHNEKSKLSKKENIYVICSTTKTNQESNLTKNVNESIDRKFTTKNCNSNDAEIYSSCIYDDLNDCKKNRNISLEFIQEKSPYSNDLVTYV